MSLNKRNNAQFGLPWEQEQAING